MNPEETRVEGVRELRALLRADLMTAMKARRPEVVSALRTALAAWDNAEAVPVREVPRVREDHGGEHVAGVRVGVGVSEAERRVLTVDEVRALFWAQVEERVAEAERYDSHGAHASADRLRREADALRKYS